ncbi:MAG: response regulator [Verrucomicrobiae bacterium]|nr:response regulator [Verrucomicrobiae bacterium]
MISQSPLPKTVLLVDDTAEVRESLARLLELECCRVVSAATASEALAKLEECQPELAVVDIHPEAGWELRRQMLARKPGLRMIALGTLPGQAEEARAAGVEVFLQKPFDLSLFLSHTRELLEGENRRRSPVVSAELATRK